MTSRLDEVARKIGAVVNRFNMMTRCADAASTVNSYASELKRAIHDNNAFDAIVDRLSVDRSIRTEEMREIAKEFLGYNLNTAKGRTLALKEIKTKQTIEMRQLGRAAQINKWAGKSW